MYYSFSQQKRGRYKNMIRQHMDFDTISSRISSQTIKSSMGLFRDLLLLANNALVFYSKCTREYKTALLLREHVTKKLRENLNGFGSSVTQANVSTTLPVHDPPVEVGRARPKTARLLQQWQLVAATEPRSPVKWVPRLQWNPCPLRKLLADQERLHVELHVRDLQRQWRGGREGEQSDIAERIRFWFWRVFVQRFPFIS